MVTRSLLTQLTHSSAAPALPDLEEGPINRLLSMLGCEPICSLAPAELHGHGGALVFLNGNLIGVHRQPHNLIRAIR